MANWSALFEEAYPVPGAPRSEIVQLVASIQTPLSRSEVARINRGQRNPFPKGDPLHDAWRPLDSSNWCAPTRPLPPSYISFLEWSNGGEFRTGERWFQFFPALDASHGVRAMLLAYHLPQYMPGAIPFALNGSGTFYAFDMRREPVDGEYTVVCSRSSNLGWKEHQCVTIAPSLAAACLGKEDVDFLF